MLSFFRQKGTVNQSLTLKKRVELFWTWYGGVAARFYETIEARKCPSLATEVTAKIDELFPGFAWVFGPGENGRGHSFTLSGEGVLHRQLITIYWQSRAPSLPGWTFYASRQPGSIVGKVIKIGERTFDPIEFWITPHLDPEGEKVDLTVWHPLFDILQERERWTILFLFLDEVLGEYGTQQSIGKISLDNRRLADAIPLQELLPFIEKTKSETGWKKYPPGESFTCYSCNQPHDRFLRGDIVAGTTCHFALIDEYADAEGELADPLAGTGGDYAYVSMDASLLPKGEESAARGMIEDALEGALKAAFSGKVLGGAHGTTRAYIDLMLFDGIDSLKLVQRVLREKQLPAGTEIHFFAKEKRGHRIVL